ncbi:cyanophycin synthetase [Moritella sp. 24]|uniref:cyanophycin synthetase n=1 Tax=Moritella sp. 24 TaxID=2746230 RepID=UPI001BA788C4|nr:cyanophycin synthetase [Moritella sp. 24]QUM75643.1 cyanophycin synthetase [Moritella sp. 24]
MKLIKQVIYKWISSKFMGGCSNYNSLEVRRGCRSKKQARDKFAEGNIPHAQGAIFFNPFTAVKFAKEHGFPLVIKPNVSGFSRGSHFPIRNYKELWRAIFFAKLWWPTTVVEQYLQGKNYRVVITKSGVISVLQRYPAFVKGDGVNTISTLINTENNVREKMGLYPCNNPISQGKQTINYLAKQGLTLSSIPDTEQQVELFYRISLAPGGVVETIQRDLIPAYNNELFAKVLDLFDAEILGIDVIMEQGIEHDAREQKLIFLEVNSRPYLNMHNFPRYGQADDLSEHLGLITVSTNQQADIF